MTAAKGGKESREAAAGLQTCKAERTERTEEEKRMEGNHGISPEKRAIYLRELDRCLREHRLRCPLAREEDIATFVFQGMLGENHLVSSADAAVSGLKSEMEHLEADCREPLYEPLGSLWCRLNLRRALSEGLWAEEIGMLMCRSAETETGFFSRQDVYDFCMGLKDTDPDSMRRAAGPLLGEDWYPEHSDAYREAYRPAYRVLMKDCTGLPDNP